MLESLYLLSTWQLAVLIFAGTVGLALFAFELAHRYPLVRFRYHEGTNDAISGTLGAIGVFYGITVGLIAIDVWQRHSAAKDLTAREAASIQILYQTVQFEDRLGTRTTGAFEADGAVLAGGAREPIRWLVADYLKVVVCDIWEMQRQGLRNGRPPDSKVLSDIRQALMSLDPQDDGQTARYEAAIQSLNQLVELRRLRTDATDDRLGGVMWAIILLGAVMTMTVVSLFRIGDLRLHRGLVGLLSGFLSLVLLMIVVNDRPFLGESAVEPDSYTALGWILSSRYGGNPFKAGAGGTLAERCARLKPAEKTVVGR